MNPVYEKKIILPQILLLFGCFGLKKSNSLNICSLKDNRNRQCSKSGAC